MYSVHINLSISQNPFHLRHPEMFPKTPSPLPPPPPLPFSPHTHTSQSRQGGLSSSYIHTLSTIPSPRPCITTTISSMRQLCSNILIDGSFSIKYITSPTPHSFVTFDPAPFIHFDLDSCHSLPQILVTHISLKNRLLNSKKELTRCSSVVKGERRSTLLPTGAWIDKP